MNNKCIAAPAPTFSAYPLLTHIKIPTHQIGTGSKFSCQLSPCLISIAILLKIVLKCAFMMTSLKQRYDIPHISVLTKY